MTVEKKNILDTYFDIKEGRIKLAQEKSSDAAVLLSNYLAMQRLMYIVFQTSHWKCKCPQFYGNHLLFQRLYGDAAELVDSTAEKIIGVFGNDALMHSAQLEVMSGLYQKYNGDNHIENSKNITADFLRLAEDLYNRLKEMEEMTLGWDDLIMAQCNKVEEFGYLLGQLGE